MERRINPLRWKVSGASLHGFSLRWMACLLPKSQSLSHNTPQSIRLGHYRSAKCHCVSLFIIFYNHDPSQNGSSKNYHSLPLFFGLIKWLSMQQGFGFQTKQSKDLWQSKNLCWGFPVLHVLGSSCWSKSCEVPIESSPGAKESLAATIPNHDDSHVYPETVFFLDC